MLSARRLFWLWPFFLPLSCCCCHARRPAPLVVDFFLSLAPNLPSDPFPPLSVVLGLTCIHSLSLPLYLSTSLPLYPSTSLPLCLSASLPLASWTNFTRQPQGFAEVNPSLNMLLLFVLSCLLLLSAIALCASGEVPNESRDSIR